MTKCVILPSIPTSMFADITSPVRLTVAKITFEEFTTKAKYCSNIINYVRHAPTNQLISKYISFTAGTEYKLNAGDRIFIVGLKTRAPVSGQDVNVTIDDLLVLEVQVE
jgi:hypothetical protein